MFRRKKKEDDDEVIEEKELEEPVEDPGNECQFCGKEMENTRKARQHERLCGKNPDRPMHAPGKTTKTTQCPHCGNEYKEGRGLTRHLHACPEKQGTITGNANKNGTINVLFSGQHAIDIRAIYTKTGGEKRWKKPLNFLMHAIQLVARDNNDNRVKPPARVDNLNWEIQYHKLLEMIKDYLEFPGKMNNILISHDLIKKPVEKPKVAPYTPTKELMVKMVKDLLKKEMLAFFAGKGDDNDE
jgi:hypothetical protein